MSSVISPIILFDSLASLLTLTALALLASLTADEASALFDAVNNVGSTIAAARAYFLKFVIMITPFLCFFNLL